MQDQITLIRLTERLKENNNLQDLISIFLDLKTFCQKNICLVKYKENQNLTKFTSAEIKIEDAFVFTKTIEPRRYSFSVSYHIYTYKAARDKDHTFNPLNSEQEVVYEKAFNEIQEIVSFYKIIKSMSSPIQIGT